MASTATPRLIHIIASSGFYGAERVVANLTQALCQRETTVFCMCQDSASIAAFERVICAGEQGFVKAPFSLTKALTLLQRIIGNDDCIVHAHGYKAVVLGALLRYRQRHSTRQSRLLVTQHGFTGRSLKGRFYNVIDKAICRWGPVERVICVSSPIAQAYRDFGVSEDRLVTIRNGAQPSQKLDRIAARELLAKRWGLDPELPWLGFAGRLSKEKNPMLFLNIVQRLYHRKVPVVAVLAGTGPERELLQQHPLFSEHPDNARILGFVTDITELLASLDCLVVPSLTEGTPMIVLEAMAQAIPVVCATVGGLPDMITDTENGLLVDGHNAEDYAALLETWLPRTRDLQRLGGAARRHVVQQLSASCQAQAYADLYGDAATS